MGLRLNRRFLAAVTTVTLLGAGFAAVKAALANDTHRKPSSGREVSDPFQIGPNLYRAKDKIIPISKIVDGFQVKVRDLRLVCPPPGNEAMRRLTYTVRAPINSWQCDEFCSNPALNGTFVATFIVDRREHKEPKRGCFTGRWSILNSLGHNIASGTLAGTVRAGTHDILTDVDPFACEQCDELFHFEGCLEGVARAGAIPRIGQPACRGRVCATFQGTGLDPDRPVPGVTPFIENPGFIMRIEGALFEPCPVLPLLNPIHIPLPDLNPEPDTLPSPQ